MSQFHCSGTDNRLTITKRKYPQTDVKFTEHMKIAISIYSLNSRLQKARSQLIPVLRTTVS